MATVLRIPTTRAQRALARYREEEEAFRLVLEVLVEWRREDLLLKLFGVYRARLRMLRHLAGELLGGTEQPYVAEELRRFVRRRDP